MTSNIGASSSLYIFKALQLQTKRFLMSDFHTQLEGQFFYTKDPFVIDVRNTTIDLFRSRALFLLEITCMYPEANLEMRFRMVNAELYFS
jgi:hypothetical protein